MGKRYLDRELDAPAGKPVKQVRPIRDEIELRARELMDDLEIEPAGASRTPARTIATAMVTFGVGV